jgi:hypothetical protein
MAKLSTKLPSFTRPYMGKIIVNYYEKGTEIIYWKRHIIVLGYTESHLIVICLPGKK